LQRQEDAIRDLANRAEVRAEQSIRKIAGYFQQKTTEFHALNRSMEETRIKLIAQIDQLQELKEELNFNHAAGQNGDPLNGARITLTHLQALTADAQRVANDLDSFGANPPSRENLPTDDGYLRVDNARLGLRLITWEEWVAACQPLALQAESGAHKLHWDAGAQHDRGSSAHFADCVGRWLIEPTGFARTLGQAGC
jgi:hypothetical protein